MFDHVGLNVSDLARSRAFYEQALAPLGIEVWMDIPGHGVGFAAQGGPSFWLAARPPVTTGAHVALACAERGLVDAFHAAALAAGGVDNGAPGLRPHYHQHYYGAFALDPDGNNVEAVCHRPE